MNEMPQRFPAWYKLYGLQALRVFFLALTFAAILAALVASHWHGGMMSGENPKLVMTAGMTYQAVQKQSTLDIGEGVYDNVGEYATRERSFVGSPVFDWQMPGSHIVFKGCRYYSMQTGYKDNPHLVHIWVTVAPDSLTWTQLKQHLATLRQELHTDGWKPDQSKDFQTGKVTDANQTIADMVDKPDKGDWNGAAGGVGASYAKGDIVLSVLARRLTPPREGEDPYSGKEFIYWIELETREHWEHYDDDSGVTLPK